MTKPKTERTKAMLESASKVRAGRQTGGTEARIDSTGIALRLRRIGRSGAPKTVRMHFDFELFAEILRELADSVTSAPPADTVNRNALRDAAMALYEALAPDGLASEDPRAMAELTPDEEVLLLHVME